VVCMFSTTKGMAALLAALFHTRGALDYDERVAAYWPEFARGGKEAITVRRLLSHQAGLAVIDEPLTMDVVADADALAEVLARQEPAWEPGALQGYHVFSFGWYLAELLRRVDPGHRTVGRMFDDEVAGPLGIDFSIGLPADFPDSRLARLEPFGVLDILRAIDSLPLTFCLDAMNPRSIAFRAATNPKLRLADFNRRDHLAVENASACGVGEARAVARAYCELGCGGKTLGISGETIDVLTEPPVAPARGFYDEVLKIRMPFSLGFTRTSAVMPFGGTRAIGMSGMGGSIGFADQDLAATFAYAPNRMGVADHDDRRQSSLWRALRACLGAD